MHCRDADAFSPRCFFSRRTGAMLVDADDGPVDEGPADVVELGLVGHGLEEPPHGPRGDPAAEAVIDGIPGAEVRGQITPGDAGACPVNQRLHDRPKFVGDEVTHGEPGVKIQENRKKPPKSITDNW